MALKQQLLNKGYRVAVCEMGGPVPHDIPLANLDIPKEATVTSVADFADDPVFEGALVLELPGVSEHEKPVFMTVDQYRQWCLELYSEPMRHYQSMLERLEIMYATLDRLGQAVIRFYGAEDGQLVLDAMAGNLNHEALAREDVIIGDLEPQASLEMLECVVAELGPELTNP